MWHDHCVAPVPREILKTTSVSVRLLKVIPSLGRQSFICNKIVYFKTEKYKNYTVIL